MADLLTIDALRVRLGGREVVRGVSLTAAGPGWIGVIGANGSGKTSLLRAVAGRLPASGGRIVIAGEDVTSSPARRARLTGDAAPLDALPRPSPRTS